jgi:dihydropyrimidinase
MHEARRAGVVVMVHAEHGDAVEYLQNRLVSQGCVEPKYHAASRPPILEAEAVNRSIALAEVTGAILYVVHVSCEESLEEVLRGRRMGVVVHAETCPQYLFTDVDQMQLAGDDAMKYVFTPPPRPKKNQPALWNALKWNDLQAISSDHSPWNLQLKTQAAGRGFTSIPNGAPGIEERMTLAFQGVVAGTISLSTFVALTSTNPARIFGIYPQKGAIESGSDADIVVWDPRAKRTFTQSDMHHNVDHTIYEGINVEGAPVTVFVRGKYVIRDNSFVGNKGYGRYLHRRTE